MREIAGEKNPPPAGEWEPGPRDPNLAEGDVHIWRAELASLGSRLADFEALLAGDEKARARRFHFDPDRNCYIAARGILRLLLGSYLQRAPASIRFEYTAYDKPFLKTDADQRGLHFNVSHSHGMVLLAFSRSGEIGVDVERIRPEFGGDEVAQRYFSARELAELRGLPAKLRAEAFFLCWTRKEAYVKACGAGLQIPLDSFSVSLTPGAPAILSSADAERWTLHSIQPGGEYAGAVVGAGEEYKLRLYRWRE